MTNLNELVGPSLGVPDAYNAIIASGKEKGWERPVRSPGRQC
jgi:hypothetical protein